MKMSIERRLFLILSVFVLANTLLWAGLTLVLAYVVEDEIIDRVLSSQSSYVQKYWEAEGRLPQPQLTELRLYQSAEELPVDLQGEVSTAVSSGEIFTPGNSHYHFRWLHLVQRSPVLLLAEVSPWLVVTLFSYAQLMFLLTGFLVALALGLVAVYAIARITTRPVRELTAAIEASERPELLPYTAQLDEVGVLAKAMDEALNSLQQALDREVAFTRDISHELRTPLTTLKNAIALLPEEARGNVHARQLQDSCSEMERIVTSLLALARADSPGLSSLNLREQLETLLLERQHTLEDREFTVELDVSPTIVVEGHRHLFRLLLANLFDNALYYASPASLRVSFQSGVLTLQNPISGTEGEAHPQSLGHGLSLVTRLAQAQGWRITTETVDNTFRVTVALKE